MTVKCKDKFGLTPGWQCFALCSTLRVFYFKCLEQVLA